MQAESAGGRDGRREGVQRWRYRRGSERNQNCRGASRLRRSRQMTMASMPGKKANVRGDFRGSITTARYIHAYSTYSSGPSLEPICVSQQHRHCTWRQPALPRTLPHWLVPSVTSDFTGTIAGNRHCSTGTIEGPLLYN